MHLWLEGGQLVQQLRVRLKDDTAAATVAAALGARLAVEADDPIELTATPLDTFDWRLWEADARLWLEDAPARRTLCWRPRPDAPSHVVPVSGEIRFAAGLPPGRLRDEVAPLLDVRTLLPTGTARVIRQLVRVTDPGGNIAVRVWYEALTAPAADPEGTTIRVASIELHELPGQGPTAARVVEHLSDLVVDAPVPDALATVAAASGRTPGDYSSKLRVPLQPEERADAAVRRLLRHLLDTMVANVDGTLADLDTEFLHDLRVASRRARSALTQLKGVFPRAATRDLADRLKWLGTVSGPARDMDVFLLEMEPYRVRLPAIELPHLEPLERAIEQERRAAHRRLRRALTSDRFTKLVAAWNRFVGGDLDEHEEPRRAALPVVELAGRRILKAYRRMVANGRAMGSSPPTIGLHALRIDAKKLRYLLELFRTLYPADRVERLIKELKRVQDLLGGVQDTSVQQVRLAELAGELSGRVPATTLLAMGRLAQIANVRQEELRSSFADRFVTFAGDEVAAQYASLCSAPGTAPAGKD